MSGGEVDGKVVENFGKYTSNPEYDRIVKTELISGSHYT